jgi:hypothetical protein
MIKKHSLKITEIVRIGILPHSGFTKNKDGTITQILTFNIEQIEILDKEYPNWNGIIINLSK